MPKHSDYDQLHDALSATQYFKVIDTDDQLHQQEEGHIELHHDSERNGKKRCAEMVEWMQGQAKPVLAYQHVKAPFGYNMIYQLRPECREQFETLKLMGSWETNLYNVPHYDLVKQVWDQTGMERVLSILTTKPNEIKDNELIIDSDGSFIPVAEYINRFYCHLCQAVHSTSFKRAMKDRIQKSKENFTSAKELIVALFGVYSRLMVVRLDFALHPDHLAKQTVEQMQAYLQRLLNNRRSNALFRELVGYVWKLEDGIKKGLHYHCILFFDGAKVQADAFYGQQIGNYWKETITEGKGTYYNCNFDKTKYRKLGIGMISHDDEDKIKNLYSLLLYLTKATQFIMVNIPGKFRCFGRSVLPKRVNAHLGRPRRVMPLPVQAAS